MTTIHNVLEDYRQTATSTRNQGDKFERLMLAYLKTDPLYQEKYSDVWLWSDWPGRDGGDTGIDLVAQERDTGEYCAIQCKFYDPAHSLQKSDIDSFFTASGKAPFSSRLIVSTTDKWGKNAEKALENQQIAVNRLRVQDLAQSPIDWEQFIWEKPGHLSLKPKKQLRPHQQSALEKVIAGFSKQNEVLHKAVDNTVAGFEQADRGKLIMACGTGKTFTSLKIAEEMAKSTGDHGFVLFLVPSISLLSQTLREWSAECQLSLHNFTVCSDTKVGKTQEDIKTHDLALPATTDPEKLASHIKQAGKRQLNVVFSTYQSIQVIAESQQQYDTPEFDLIICDEAHRTTGATLADKEESKFVRIHDENYIQGKKRLYMTATPRLYDDSAKSKAQENNASLCSMDDESLYGKEFHRLGFSEAVSSGLLSDYKVMVLAVDEKYVSKTFQTQLADDDNQLNLEDAVKITGCWNGLSKRMARDLDGNVLAGDNSPMRRAVAFCQNIKASKQITSQFADIVSEYHQTHEDNDNLLHCEVDHVDGTFNALARNQRLDWLKAESQGNTCRILSNARCLSEGVDVPALDAVMFLTPRNSVVDVVQSVGRVMRKADGKQYGYIILPIGIPADLTPEEALRDNKKYKVVWQVLQALRAHDDRFNATVNKLELNQSKPDNIQVIGVTGGDADDDGGTPSENDTNKSNDTGQQGVLNFPHIDEWRDAIYAKIVQKCGQRRYWEDWAKDIAAIAERHISRIKALLESLPQHKATFDTFLQGLRNNLNPAISTDDAIEMLAQHLITQPVFDALFEDYDFTQHNPVSQAMQAMLDVLHEQSLRKETATLERFYASVKMRAKGIDNATGKQKIIVELYDKFFRAAFPRMAERLGIVYTPTEVVDFIIHSTDAALQQEFGKGLSDQGVHILDPFTGTGTFMARLLQSGLIKPEDLQRKYQQELHANELVLLAYYIAAVNIEAAYHGAAGGDYQPFNGIVLTDTFQMTEGRGDMQGWVDAMLPANSDRAKQQNKQVIQVIVGNPPYSAKQTSENDNNKNLQYPNLDSGIRDTYAACSSATNKNSLYDSYIRAIRWASDRIADKGIVCFVTNGSFIDSNAMDGLRQSLTDEFNSIYCFNLRGNARTSGEERRKERGNVFGEGTRTNIAITLLVKNPEKGKNCQLFYHDIGDYLSQKEKLNIIDDFHSIQGIDWKTLKPNAAHDWINQRDPAFDKFISLGDKKDKAGKVIFSDYSRGIATSRDTWTYHFNKQQLENNMQQMIDFYNAQVAEYKALQNKSISVDKFINTDATKISWSVSLKNNLGKEITHSLNKSSVVCDMYRPYCKQWVYFDKNFNDRRYQMPRIFPKPELKNLVIYVSGIGAGGKDASALIVDTLPDLNMQHSGGQGFPLYTYEKIESSGDLFGIADEYIKQDAIPDSILAEFQKTYTDTGISKKDIFYYVYGLMHSPEYKTRFAANLKKELPRIPFAQDFWAFSKAGRELADWHINYESIDPYPVQESAADMLEDKTSFYRVQKMQFAKKGKEKDKTTIIYNSRIILSNIPLQAYDYIVNGKPALEWLIDRYQVTIDKKSGIKNDPNDWSEDPRYIIDLVKRIVRVSLESVRIVESLPPLNEQV